MSGRKIHQEPVNSHMTWFKTFSSCEGDQTPEQVAQSGYGWAFGSSWYSCSCMMFKVPTSVQCPYRDPRMSISEMEICMVDWEARTEY